jgi:hypothetical protein
MEMFNVKRRDNPSMDNWSDIKKPAFGGPNEKADFDKAKKTKLKEYQRIVERNPDAEGGRFNPNYDSAWKGFTSDIIYRTAKKKSYEPMYAKTTIAVIDAIEEGNIIRFEEFINENMSDQEEFDEYGNEYGKRPAKFNPDSEEPVEYLEEDEDEVDTFDEFEEEEQVDLGYEVDEEQLDKLLEEFGDELQTMITNICETMEMEKSEVCDLLCAAIEKKCNEEDSEEDSEDTANNNEDDV